MIDLLKKLPFYSKPWFQFLLFLVRHYFEDNCQQKAASLTYTTMLSIVPIITVVLVILSSVPALESVREEFQAMLYNNLLPQSSVQVSQYINDFAEKSSNLTAIGVLVLFVTTIMTLLTIESAFNQIWRVDDKSGGLSSVIRYWTIVTLGPLLLGTALIVSGTVQSLSFLNQNIAGYGIDWAIWVQLASFIVTMAGFVGMYWFIPKAHVPFKNSLIAGIIIAILFETLKQVFGTVMSNFTSYEAIYGAFAALPIFLLWIHLSWNLILLGVEISYTLTIFETKEVYPRHPLFSLLDMLNLVYKKYQNGEDVSEQELRDVLGRRELPKWYSYINLLKRANLIASTDNHSFVLKKDLSSMSLWQFYKQLPYPLPIKDELDEMAQSQHDDWFQPLVDVFENTENLVKKQLDIPLLTIFHHTKVRKSSCEETQAAAKQTQEETTEIHDKPIEGTVNFYDDKETASFSPDAKQATDATKQPVLIPTQTTNQNNHDDNKNHQADKTQQTAPEKKPSQPNLSKKTKTWLKDWSISKVKQFFRQKITNKRKPIISEKDASSSTTDKDTDA